MRTSLRVDGFKNVRNENAVVQLRFGERDNDLTELEINAML